MRQYGFLIGASAFLVAATVALYATRLGYAPIYLIHDEVKFSLQAIAIAESGHDLNGRLLPVYFSEPEFVAGRDPMMIYATALALRVLPLSDASVRLSTALVGVIDVLLILVLARQVFKSDVLALAAAAMLALAPGHFIHSRMALSVMYPLPFVILWLIGLSRFTEQGSRRAIYFGAAALGLGIYGYLAGMIMMPLYLVFTGLILAEKRALRLVPGVVAAFACVLIPIVIWQLVHPERAAIFGAYRVGDVTSGVTPGISSFLAMSRVKLMVGAWWSYFDPDYLFLSGDSSMTNSTRQAGLFPLAAAVLMPLGIYALASRRGLARLVLVGLISAPLAVVLTGTLDLNRYRGLFVLPFGVLVSTYGLEFLWTRSRIWRWAAIVLIVSMPLQFWGFYQDYMGPYRDSSGVWFGKNVRGAVAEAISHADAHDTVLVSRGVPYGDAYWDFYSRALAAPDRRPAGRVIDAATFDRQSAAAGTLLVMSAGESWPADPGWSVVKTITEPDGSPSFVVYRRNGGR